MNLAADASVRDIADLIRGEVQKAFIGSTKCIDAMLVALFAHGHVLLEGVPGIAKTTLVKAFAAATGCSTRRIQFTPDLLPADITGTYVLSPKTGTFELRKGPIFAQIVLADEINRAPAKTQSALLEAMQERHVTIDGEELELPNPFVVLATQNPVDFDGTYPLPEAQVDRFLMRVTMGYPSARDEATMLRAYGRDKPEVRPVLSLAQLYAIQRHAANTHIEGDLLEYAVAIAAYTRSHPRVSLGASPRATLGLVQASKAHAALVGRAFVTPEDLQAMAPYVLCHRLVLTGDAPPHTAESIVAEALRRVSYRSLGSPR